MIDYKKELEVELEDACRVVARIEQQLEQINKRSPGCDCDPRDWRKWIIGPICEAFVPSISDAKVCMCCEHHEGCHTLTPVTILHDKTPEKTKNRKRKQNEHA